MASTNTMRRAACGMSRKEFSDPDSLCFPGKKGDPVPGGMGNTSTSAKPASFRYPTSSVSR